MRRLNQSLLFGSATLRHLFSAEMCSCAKPRAACFLIFGKDGETGIVGTKITELTHLSRRFYMDNVLTDC